MFTIEFIAMRGRHLPTVVKAGNSSDTEASAAERAAITLLRVLQDEPPAAGRPDGYRIVDASGVVVRRS
jgi:hypothetical protein